MYYRFNSRCYDMLALTRFLDMFYFVCSETFFNFRLQAHPDIYVSLPPVYKPAQNPLWS